VKILETKKARREASSVVAATSVAAATAARTMVVPMERMVTGKLLLRRFELSCVDNLSSIHLYLIVIMLLCQTLLLFQTISV
jgi:hypothetical protein